MHLFHSEISIIQICQIILRSDLELSRSDTLRRTSFSFEFPVCEKNLTRTNLSHNVQRLRREITSLLVIDAQWVSITEPLVSNIAPRLGNNVRYTRDDPRKMPRRLWAKFKDV